MEVLNVAALVFPSDRLTGAVTRCVHATSKSYRLSSFSPSACCTHSPCNAAPGITASWGESGCSSRKVLFLVSAVALRTQGIQGHTGFFTGYRGIYQDKPAKVSSRGINAQVSGRTADCVQCATYFCGEMRAFPEFPLGGALVTSGGQTH